MMRGRFAVPIYRSGPKSDGLPGSGSLGLYIYRFLDTRDGTPARDSRA